MCVVPRLVGSSRCDDRGRRSATSLPSSVDHWTHSACAQDRLLNVVEMDWLWLGFYHAAAMLWETFWALVLGFSISAALQVFVNKEQMSRLFGRTNLKTMLLATGLGAA